MGGMTLKIILFVTILAVTICSHDAKAEPSALSKEPGGKESIQGFAPDPELTQEINKPTSIMINIRDRLFWELINTRSNCYARILTSHNKGKVPKIPLELGMRTGYVVHKKAVFLNLSGCTGILLMQ